MTSSVASYSWGALLRRLHGAGPLCCALLLLGATGAHAANPLDLARQAASPETSAPEVIAAAEIPLRADVDERFIHDVQERAVQSDPIERLAPQLEQLANSVLALSRTLKSDELPQLSAVRLQSLENHWRFYDRQLDLWRRELERVTASYSNDAAALAKRRAVWEATQASAEASNAALNNRVNGLLQQIAQAEAALSGPLERQFQLRRRANNVQSSIDGGLKEVDAAIAHYDQRLTMIDAPPLWEVLTNNTHAGATWAGSAMGWQIEAQFLDEWTAANQHRIRAYGLLALVLLPLLILLSRRSRSIVATDPGIAAAAKMLRRPVSVWLVLVLVGQMFVFTDAPMLVHQVAALLAVIPVLRLLPPQVFRILGSWPYIGTALFVVHRMRFPLLTEPLNFRLYIVSIALAGTLAIGWLLLSRRGTQPAGASESTRRRIRLLGWLAIGALLTAIGANIVGNVSLAEMLTGAVLDSAYGGLVFLAGAMALASMLNLLLARRSVRFRVITQHAGPLLASANRLIMAAALASWVLVTLASLHVARPVFAWAQGVLSYPLEAGQISVTLGNILLFVFSVWVAFWIARTIRFLLRDEFLPKMALPRGVSNSIATLTYYAVVVIGLLVALAAAGFETSQFAIVFGALGVGIGFGLQNVVNNFVSGLILMFERPIQPGDVVEVSGTSGKVRSIGMRATTLTTFEGADVVVPNGTLLSEKLINWTLSDMTRRVDVDVGVAYGSDPRRVLELLAEVAASTPGISPEPAPSVLFVRMASSSLDFGVRAWTSDFNNWVAIRTEMTARIYEALRREGIEIPFPQQDLHLRTVTEHAGARLQGSAATNRGAPASGATASMPGPAAATTASAVANPAAASAEQC